MNATGSAWTAKRRYRIQNGYLAALSLACSVAAATSPATAFRIELKDVAPDRVERQRAEAIGLIPLPGTPNIAQFEQRLKDKGLAAGNAMFIRVFKAESELEVWMQKGATFELFATYPMCHWSGTLGPKVVEGDKQSPEGVYTVSARQIHVSGRHPKALNLGFPNPLDKQFQRTGSYLLIHGGCGSVGCYAMTNPVIDEIFTLAQAALKNGQDAINVHAFPFRLTEQKLRAYALNEWYDFWRNLKDVHDAFERTKRVPRVMVCEGRYWVDPGSDPTLAQGEVASQGPLVVCGAPQEVASSNKPTENAVFPTIGSSWNPLPRAQQVPLANLPQSTGPYAQQRGAQARVNGPRSQGSSNRLAGPLPLLTSAETYQMRDSKIACLRSLASCRKWIAHKTIILERRQAAGRAAIKTAAAAPTRGPQRR
jgi:murein L,D-transpeptidase YafK